MKHLHILIPLILIPLYQSSALAEPGALEIATKALESNLFSTGNAQATLDMDIERGGKVIKQRRITTMMSRKGGEVRSFVEFQTPADVAGTRFLSIEKDDDTRQFIYLPAFKKVKRIVGAQRSGSFMGTDFSYADLEGRDVKDATWKRSPDGKAEGQSCYVVEGLSKKKDDTYGKVVLWVEKKTMVPLRGDFYDSEGKTVSKRLSVKKLGKKDGRWITMESVMKTLAKGSSTRLRVASIDLKSPIPEAKLTRQALER